MKVIGAGFARTGTTSLKAALEQLGFGPCYHMTVAERDPRHLELWNAAAKGYLVDWDRIFAGYESTLDWPGCAFYAQLARAYPDARVVLTVRDPERWYDSLSGTIYAAYRRVVKSPVLSKVIRFPNRELVVSTMENVVWTGTFGGRFEDRRAAIEVFERHVREVRERVPPDRLLVFDVREGWEPLCRFLEVEAPATAFPHLNDSQSFHAASRDRLKRLLVPGALRRAHR